MGGAYIALFAMYAVAGRIHGKPIMYAPPMSYRLILMRPIIGAMFELFEPERREDDHGDGDRC